ncbi:TPA: Eco29kI family restriction endonuclease, partial [Pseudomonas aeruginosa]|nr:Eco29kI family restriction endonuclease [Pseudomonas aeruginosa]
MTGKVIPFNPLDKKNLGASVAEALLTKEVHPLGDLPVFEGAGIYAIYYTGGFAPYAQVSRLNADGKFMLPIYVGKAVPPGARMGASLELAAGKVLHKRLKEHAESIKAAENLDIKDFHCRFLVVDDIWIPLGESLIIARFTPVWNSLIDGFGNHNPGKGRHAGMRPRWDVLHPGREWAMRLAERPETQAQIAQDA